MKSLRNLLRLFYPETCVYCETYLLAQEKVLCLQCRFDLPLVENANYKENYTKQIFEGRVEIEKAASFLYYTPKGKTQQLIHDLKYRGNQQIGTFIGEWFGQILYDSGHFHDIDCIVPVPLHKKRFKKRGYNQLTTFGRTLSRMLKVAYCENVLERVSSDATQTFKKRLERFSNIDSKFIVNKLSVLQGKHILLIDDVVTTGATLEACCKELLRIKNVKISIVTIALTP